MGFRVTLKKIRDGIRTLADMDGDFLSDDDINLWINESKDELHDILVETYNKHFISEYLINTVVNQDDYDVPEDVYKINKLEFIQSNRRYDVLPVSLRDQDLYIGSSRFTGLSVAPFKYLLIGEVIRLLPSPNSVDSVAVTYTPNLPELIEDDDSISLQISPGWHRFIIYDVCSRCKAAEDLDPNYFAAERENQRRRIVNHAKNRDSNYPQRMSNFRRPRSIYPRY